jgi:hypothetical protein
MVLQEIYCIYHWLTELKSQLITLLLYEVL